MTTSKSFANGNGPSEAGGLFGGNALPPWLRMNREFAEVWEWRYSSWTVQA